MKPPSPNKSHPQSSKKTKVNIPATRCATDYCAYSTDERPCPKCGNNTFIEVYNNPACQHCGKGCGDETFTRRNDPVSCESCYNKAFRNALL